MHNSMFRHFLELNNEQWRDRDALEHMQMKKLEQILESAQKTKYYRDLMAENGIPANDLCLESLPITEKKAVKYDPDSFIQDGVRKESLRMVKTSGSTGTPLPIYISPESSAYRRTLLVFAPWMWGRGPLDLVARIVSSGSPNRPLNQSRLGMFRNLILSACDDEVKNFSIIKKNRADILTAYPSILGLLARLNQQDENPVKFKYVGCGGEILLPEIRKLIEESFSCNILNHYACWEFGLVAWTCPEEHNLHIVSSSVIPEIVDSKGKPKKGGDGDIVLTGLHNHAMPLLRYRMGDIGSWGTDCPCGRGLPVLKSVKGRSDDIVILPSGRIRSAASFFMRPTSSVINETLIYQLVQEREDLFVLRYIPCGHDMSKDTKQEFEQRIKNACLGEEVSVEFEAVNHIKREKSGKFQRVISRVKRE